MTTYYLHSTKEVKETEGHKLSSLSSSSSSLSSPNGLVKISREALNQCPLLAEQEKELTKTINNTVTLNVEIDIVALKKIVSFLEFMAVQVAEEKSAAIDYEPIPCPLPDTAPEINKYICEWEANYLHMIWGQDDKVVKHYNELQMQNFMSVLRGAHTLQLDRLVFLCCAKLASDMKQHSFEQLLKLYNIKKL